MAPRLKPCSQPGCPQFQPCPNHAPKPWAGHQGRHGRMRSGSREQKINRAVMLRDNGRCHICGEYGADIIDHVTPLSEGGSDDMDNRKPAHAEPCHARKTQQEAARARTH